MFRSLNRMALTAAASVAALGFAAPASAAMQFNPNGSVTVSGNSGGSVVLNFNGNSEGVNYTGLTSSLTLTFVSAVNGLYTFSYSLANTSTSPISSARLNAFGFNTDPNVVMNGASIIDGSILTSVKYNTNVPNGVGNVELCFTTNNCAGGGSTGVNIGDAAATGSFSLNFGNTNLETLTLSNFAVRYQALSVGSGSGTGQVVTTAVPEPGTWALMLVGFGAIGFAMRRRRQASGLLQMA